MLHILSYTTIYMILLACVGTSTGENPTLTVPSSGNCGEDTVLTCQRSSPLGTSYALFKQDTTIVTQIGIVFPDDQDKYSVSTGTNSFSVTIKDTKLTDGSSYRCRMGFDTSEFQTVLFECKAKTVTLAVSKAKKLTLTFTDVYPAANSVSVKPTTSTIISGSQTCSTTSSSMYNCVWTSISSVADGDYTCIVTVTTITTSSPLSVSFKIITPLAPTISNKETISDSREVVRGVEGKSVTLTCISSGGTPEPTVAWYRNSTSTTALTSASTVTQQSDGTYTVTLTYTVTAANRTRDDKKSFMCRSYYPQATSTATQGSRTSSVLMYLSYKAFIVSFTETHHPSASNVTLNENEAVSLQCVVESNPGSTIDISKNGETIQKVFNSTKADYSIIQVTCQDAGTYTCMCFNDYNDDGARPSQEVHLFVPCSPRLAGSVKSNLTTGIQETAILSVNAVAYPAPTNYAWAKLTGSTWTPLTSNSSVHIWSQGLQYKLIIFSVKPPDYGQYRLSITNIVGVFQHLFYISPQVKPAAPTGLRYIAESISETSAAIEWSPGFNGGLQQIFVVLYRPVFSMKWNVGSFIHSSETTMNITLDGLSRGITYEVQLYTFNSIGNSSSEIIDFTTLDVTSPTTASLTAGAAGGIAGGVVAVVVLIIGIVLARRNHLKLYCNCKKDENNTQDVDTTINSITTDKDEDIPDSAVSYYNAEEIRNPPSQYTALAFNDTSTRAYDSLHNIELGEIPQTNQQYENVNI